jgi:hypothetical protein
MARKGKPVKYQLPGIEFATWTSTVRKLHQPTDGFMHFQGNAASGPGSFMFFGVIANVRKIACGKLRPTDTHQPGY